MNWLGCANSHIAQLFGSASLARGCGGSCESRIVQHQLRPAVPFVDPLRNEIIKAVRAPQTAPLMTQLRFGLWTALTGMEDPSARPV